MKDKRAFILPSATRNPFYKRGSWTSLKFLLKVFITLIKSFWKSSPAVRGAYKDGSKCCDHSIPGKPSFVIGCPCHGLFSKRFLAAGGIFIFAYALFCMPAGPVESKKSTRRFVMVVGANDGGKARTKLRYAVSDARSVLKVLRELGGVLPEDSLFLEEPNRKTFFGEMSGLENRVKKAQLPNRRVEVIFYYSGHSDETCMLLGEEKVSYQDFMKEFDSLAADVRIAILDSCASGAFTRLKGGKKTQPFLFDSAFDMKGYAIMTSSSVDEASQESERIKGAFFTHYLVSGLRGAADMTHDGKITLYEAYQFAFKETLAQTTATFSGPQHPNYNIRMSGTGDVVITDIRQGRAILEISEDIFGRVFIYDKNQELAAELDKSEGQPIQLSLDEGKYRVLNFPDPETLEADINLEPGKTFKLVIQHFRVSGTGKIPTVTRGDMGAALKPVTMLRPGRFSVTGRGGLAIRNDYTPMQVGYGFQLALSYLSPGRRWGYEAALGYHYFFINKKGPYPDDTEHVVLNLYRYFPPGKANRLFICGGIGFYGDGGKITPGLVVGGGYERNFSPHFAFEAGLIGKLNLGEKNYFLVSGLLGWKIRL